MTKFQDLTGQKFGRLTVIKHSHSKNYRHYWLCKCECGSEKIIRGSHLTSGAIRSCGCYNIERLRQRKKHHLTHSRLYIIWNSMLKRCNNSNDKGYKNYGGRGIKVCQEWQDDFMNFYNWAIAHGYDENAERGECTIDRINVNGDYTPNNCKWANWDVQMNNTRRNKFITYDNKTYTISQWSNLIKIPYHTLYRRLNFYNYSIKDAFEKPIKRRK